MVKCYNGKGSQAILFLLQKNKLTKTDIGRLLNVSKPTLYKLINEPFLMTLQQLNTLAGCFGVTTEELVYCIKRNKPQMNKQGKWYLDGLISKAEVLSMP